MRLIFRVIWYLIVFISLVVLLPGNVLLDIEPKEFDKPLPEILSGTLKPNERLSQTVKVFENKLLGPESVAAFDGKLVTGTNDGFLYQIDGRNMKPLLKLVEKSCADNPYNTTKCGRPLGLKFDSKGTLFVVEPNVGVFSVQNIFSKNPKVDLIFNIEDSSVLGKPSKMINDLAIDEGAGLNGGHVIYISDMSAKFDMSQSVFLVLGSDTGRVIKYDINANNLEIIAENLWLPNGLELTDNKNAILLNEFIRRQVIKIYIKGPKTGQSEIICANLPGEPDNIRRSASKKETYWIALFNARTNSNQNKLDYYLKRPLLRKVMCRLLHLFGNIIEFFGNIFNNSLVKEFGYDMKNGKQLNHIIFEDESNNIAMILEIDINGQIVDSLHASNHILTHISEVREVRVNDKESILYLGSYVNNYLGEIKINR